MYNLLYSCKSFPASDVMEKRSLMQRYEYASEACIIMFKSVLDIQSMPKKNCMKMISCKEVAMRDGSLFCFLMWGYFGESALEYTWIYFDLNAQWLDERFLLPLDYRNTWLNIAEPLLKFSNTHTHQLTALLSKPGAGGHQTAHWAHRVDPGT